MTTNTLYIDHIGRAHILIVPPAPRPDQHPWREPPFVLKTEGLHAGWPITMLSYRHGPYLRARGSVFGRALRFVDVTTLAADLDAEIVEIKEAFDEAVENAKVAYEEERSNRLAAATIASTAQRSASAFASA